MTVVYNQTALMAGTNDGDLNNGQNYRVSIPASVLGAASGNQMRVSMMWGTLATAVGNGITSMWMGQRGATDPDFSGNQVQVKWGGSGTLNSALGASCTSGTIAATVLTVAGTLTGTFQVGQLISGVGVTVGTTITSLGTGTGGAGTYNLSASSTVSVGETINANAIAISDYITLGENYDNTKPYEFAWHFTSTGPSVAVSTPASIAMWADGGAQPDNASSSHDTGQTSQGNLLLFLYMVEVQTGTADVLASQIWL